MANILQYGTLHPEIANLADPNFQWVNGSIQRIQAQAAIRNRNDQLNQSLVDRINNTTAPNIKAQQLQFIQDEALSKRMKHIYRLVTQQHLRGQAKQVAETKLSLITMLEDQNKLKAAYETANSAQRDTLANKIDAVTSEIKDLSATISIVSPTSGVQPVENIITKNDIYEILSVCDTDEQIQKVFEIYKMRQEDYNEYIRLLDEKTDRYNLDIQQQEDRLQYRKEDMTAAEAEMRDTQNRMADHHRELDNINATTDSLLTKKANTAKPTKKLQVEAKKLQRLEEKYNKLEDAANRAEEDRWNLETQRDQLQAKVDEMKKASKYIKAAIPAPAIPAPAIPAPAIPATPATPATPQRTPVKTRSKGKKK